MPEEKKQGYVPNGGKEYDKMKKIVSGYIKNRSGHDLKPKVKRCITAIIYQPYQLIKDDKNCPDTITNTWINENIYDKDLLKVFNKFTEGYECKDTEVDIKCKNSIEAVFAKSITGTSYDIITNKTITFMKHISERIAHLCKAANVKAINEKYFEIIVNSFNHWFCGLTDARLKRIMTNICQVNPVKKDKKPSKKKEKTDDNDDDDDDDDDDE